MKKQLLRNGCPGMILLVVSICLALFIQSCTQATDGVPGNGSEGDAIMGDWQGTLITADGTSRPLAAQVIALDSGRYEANMISAFNQRQAPILVLNGSKDPSGASFSGLRESGDSFSGAWQGHATAKGFSGEVSGKTSGSFKLEKVRRHSETLDAKPPPEAVILFDGTNLDHWEHRRDFVGLINLNKILGGRHRAAYLRTEVFSKGKQKAFLELGSDDGIKVWLNGELIHGNNVLRGFTPGQDKVAVTLKTGWNRVLMKVINGTSGWGASARLVDSAGEMLQGIGEKDGTSPMGTRKHMEAKAGYLTVWQLSGPYFHEGKEAPDLFDLVFAPEKGEPAEPWRDIAPERDYTPTWGLVDNAMEVTPRSSDLVTKKAFEDFRLHLEFRTPFMRDKRGQARGNSGVYLQGSYEVQVLDSYGLEGKDNECGGIYKVAVPRVNMCAPPLQWQTYDITFRAPRFDPGGKKTKNALITVFHNGVKIHDQVEIPNPTGSHLNRDLAAPGPLMLQDHGDPVQYRNIWLVEL